MAQIYAPIISIGTRPVRLHQELKANTSASIFVIFRISIKRDSMRLQNTRYQVAVLISFGLPIHKRWKTRAPAMPLMMKAIVMGKANQGSWLLACDNNRSSPKNAGEIGNPTKHRKLKNNNDESLGWVSAIA